MLVATNYRIPRIMYARIVDTRITEILHAKLVRKDIKVTRIKKNPRRKDRRISNKNSAGLGEMGQQER